MTEAIILVGGEGTRLRPLTERTPKPMLPVAGVPLVVHQIAKLAAAGIGHVVLATSYRAETFRELGDGSAFGVRLEYVVEDEPLGTGGAIRHAAQWLDGVDETVILNGDVLSGHDIPRQLGEHRRSGAVATLHLVRVADARAFGCVPTDADGRVEAFLEKMPEPVSNQINAGCYVFGADAMAAIPLGERCSVERDTFPALLGAGVRLQGYLDDAEWLDLGTPADYVTGCCDVVTGDLPSPALPAEPGPFLVLPGATVHATAHLAGGSTVGADARVGADAVVESSVLLSGAVVDAGARLRRSVVGAGAGVGAAAVLDEVIVGDGATVPAGAVPPPGTRIAGGTTYRPG